MDKRIGTCTRKDIGKYPLDEPLTFADINGRHLSLSTGTWPFRRAIAWVSRTSFTNAIASRAPHSCATSANPTEDEWDKTYNDVRNESMINDSSVFSQSDVESDSEY